MNLPAIILASASPRRSDLLREAGFDFVVQPAVAREVRSSQLTPREIVQINACRKCRVVAHQFPDALVLGADTEVCLGAEILGKPADLGDARRMLLKLQGKTHEVITGVCLIHRQARRHRLFAIHTAVVFRALTARQIQAYHKLVNPLDKAGAYGIQEHGARIIESIRGSYSNVVGLPMERLLEELQAFAL